MLFIIENVVPMFPPLVFFTVSMELFTTCRLNEAMLEGCMVVLAVVEVAGIDVVIVSVVVGVPVPGPPPVVTLCTKRLAPTEEPV